MEDFLRVPSILSFGISTPISYVILSIIFCVIYFIARTSSLILGVIYLSLFSVLVSILYLLFDAPDVALTETALGAAFSTCVLVNIVIFTGQKSPNRASKIRKAFAIMLCIIFSLCLAYLGADLPEIGENDSPIQSHLTNYYLQNTKSQIGIPSFVAAILASYRGFDTLGEALVILIAGVSVFFILSTKSEKQLNTIEYKKIDANIQESSVTLLMIRFITPYVFLYSIYIQLNGEISPGGGFQAGVIFASAIVLLCMLRGKEDVLKTISLEALMLIGASGVVIYFGVGIMCMVLGGDFLDYSALVPQNPILGQHIGIFLIEIGVGITVSSIMSLIYILLDRTQKI